MKSLTAFLRVLLHEMGEQCGTSTTRDLKTIARRVEHEGDSFLTISLASFGKDLQKGLDQGFVDRNMFQGFSWHAGLPRFLGGFLDLVFDRGTGRLLDFPSIPAIRALFQITLAFAKVERECSKERTQRAYDGYLKCEKELRVFDASFVGSKKDQFQRIGRLLWTETLTELDHLVFTGQILPKHGSGSTADGLRGNAKYRQREWTDRLEEVFPAGENLFPTYSHFLGADMEYLEPGAERPVRVITVPKTLKTPRIIAMEPTCMMFMQQGIHEVIQEAFRRFDTPRSFICYDSQEHNRSLAREGSITGALATLDLSEASDRVSNQHVRALLENHPHLARAVDATRSRKADVLGEIVRLAKFASMGSALCFPMEAMVFCTLVFVGIEEALNRPLTQEDIKSFKGQVRVYGDDIIVPVEYVHSVVGVLTSFGMKVNASKSFWTGKFRESCGGEYFDGHDVTYVKVRRDFPSRLEHVEEIVSTVELRNQLFERGHTHTVDYLDRIITRILPVYPVVERTSPGLGRWDWSPPKAERFHPSLHKPLVKACVVQTTLPSDVLDGVDALTKWFLKRGDKPFEDKNHLLRAGRPVSVRIKTQWVSPV